MMRVVDFDDEVRDGELQLMHPQPPGLVLRREPEPRAEPVEDQRGLRDDGLAGFQDRRREWRMLLAPALHEGDVALSASLARDIDIVGACLFKCEADEFAASLNGRPVIKLVAHDVLSRRLAANIPRPSHTPSTRHAWHRATPASRCEPCRCWAPRHASVSRSAESTPCRPP